MRVVSLLGTFKMIVPATSVSSTDVLKLEINNEFNLKKIIKENEAHLIFYWYLITYCEITFDKIII